MDGLKALFHRIPATLNLALPSLLISALNAILAAFSEVYILVLGIYYKLQTFLYLPANGFVQGMRPLIGFNYGAGEKGRVRQIYRIVLFMSGIIMIFGTLICLAVPGPLIGLFTHSQETIQAGESALRIISAGFVVSAVSVTSSGALEGLGKGVPSLSSPCSGMCLSSYRPLFSSAGSSARQAYGTPSGSRNLSRRLVAYGVYRKAAK